MRLFKTSLSRRVYQPQLESRVPCGMCFLDGTDFKNRKEVIHPQLRLGIPCYDLVPIAEFGLAPLAGLFGRLQLCWLDGRCVQDPRTYSPQPADLRLLPIPTS